MPKLASRLWVNITLSPVASLHSCDGSNSYFCRNDLCSATQSPRACTPSMHPESSRSSSGVASARSNIRHHIGLSSRRWKSTRSPSTTEIGSLLRPKLCRKFLSCCNLRSNRLWRRVRRLRDGRRGRDSLLSRQFSQPFRQFGIRSAVVFVVIANAFQNVAALPIARLFGRHPVRVLNDRSRSGRDVRPTFRSVKRLDAFDGVAVFANTQA